MFNFLLTEEEKKLKQEVKRFVKEEVPSSLIRAMDADEVKYPKEFIESLAAYNLLGLRFSKEWGGRGMRWTGEVAAIEEIGVLGIRDDLPLLIGEHRGGGDPSFWHSRAEGEIFEANP